MQCIMLSLGHQREISQQVTLVDFIFVMDNQIFVVRKEVVVLRCIHEGHTQQAMHRDCVISPLRCLPFAGCNVKPVELGTVSNFLL